jgi:hypothetical protein
VQQRGPVDVGGRDGAPGRERLAGPVLAALLLALPGSLLYAAYDTSIEEARRAEERVEADHRFERARQGDGAGVVPGVSWNCAINRASLARVEETWTETGLDGPEQIALAQLVAAVADCSD